VVCGGCDADDGHEGIGGFLVSRGDGSPRLEARPQVLDQMPVPIRPFRTGDLRFVAFRRNDRA